MRKVYKKKLYPINGILHAELRDFEVNKYVKANTPVRVIIGDEYMDISVDKLKKGTVTNTQRSIINPGQTYKLIGFRWHPTPYRDPQASLFYSANKLQEAMKRNGVRIK